MNSLCLRRLLSLYHLLIRLLQLLKHLPVAAADLLVSAYYRFHGLSPSTLRLPDNQTSLQIWAATRRRTHKPNLLLIHGYGGSFKWQFFFQVAHLARNFNLYIPDLVFFGGSYSTRPERTVGFQAECLASGLRRLGVEKFSVYAISYGGFVAYWMAAMEAEMVEKVVIVSSGIVCRHDRKLEHVRKIGRSVVDLLVAKRPEDVRMLCRMSMHKFDILKWVPDFLIQEFLDLEGCKKEKEEMVEELLSEKHDIHNPVLTQETLLIWGDKDLVFPLDWAHQLHRHLGEKSKLEILKDVGHAANMEAPDSLNRLITSFVLTR